MLCLGNVILYMRFYSKQTRFLQGFKNKSAGKKNKNDNGKYARETFIFPYCQYCRQDSEKEDYPEAAGDIYRIDKKSRINKRYY